MIAARRFSPFDSRTFLALTVGLLLVGALPDPADAQCNPGGGPGGVGADLIVGSIDSIGGFGIVNGFSAYALGISICNIGTAPAPWLANTDEHPVVLTNLYRIVGGRCEQVGSSWMRHGFAALSQDGCGCGCLPGGLDSLGVGCSDTSSAFLAGQQTALAAPSELLDATAVSFTFPPALSPPIPDATARRLRVAVADVDPFLNLGAGYFVEAIVYSAADAAGSAPFDGASVREVVVAPAATNFALGPASPTLQRTSALEIWATVDPTVELVSLDDGSGGRIIVAARVEQSSATEWTYEYAIQNLNSERAVATVTVPVGLASIANPGFHDCDPHSGDILSGTDWAFADLGSTLVWSTDSFAVDPLANAIRAGHTHNFRFTTDVAPVLSNLTLGLFTPGAVSTLDAALPAPSIDLFDCNGNGVDDSDDLLAGTSLDCNANAIPDECEEPVYRRGDSNVDGTVNVADAVKVLGELFLGQPIPCEAAGDVNGDAGRNVADAVFLLTYLFQPGATMPGAPFPDCGVAPSGAAFPCCEPECP